MLAPASYARNQSMLWAGIRHHLTLSVIAMNESETNMVSKKHTTPENVAPLMVSVEQEATLDLKVFMAHADTFETTDALVGIVNRLADVALVYVKRKERLSRPRLGKSS